MLNACGVDGCRGGWFWVALGDRSWDCGIVERLGHLPCLCGHRARILVDIPIGLRDNGPAPRLCDTAARALLGKARASSVFPVPCRAAVHAAPEDAQRVNRAHTGHGLSCQTLNIVPKIRQADELLRSRPALRRAVRESHPEVCFHVLNGMTPLRWGKKSREGRSERLLILGRHCRRTEQVYAAAVARYRRAKLARDDILDALVLAVTAARPGRLPTLPEKPEQDATGVPMEIVCPPV